MTTTWTPLRSYGSTYHVLGAGACFCHPGNGNVYFYACEKVDAQHQNLVIYRYVAASGAFEMVVTFIDGDASQGFIERGGCVIDNTGALWVATSLQPKDKPYDPQRRTGYEGVWCVIPNVDQPYASTSALEQRIAALERLIAALPPTTTGPILRVPAQTATEGGEVQFAYNGGVYFLDVSGGVFRLVKQEAGQPGRVLQTWG